jgi:dephospho-CoA kinase
MERSLSTLKSMTRPLTPLIGLTGGSGVGKSTIAKCLEELGCNIINFDIIDREVRAMPSVRKEIESTFKTSNPLELRKIVFSKKKSLNKLNSILEDKIIYFAIKQSEEIRRNNDLPIIWDGALLIELGLHKCVDLTILVSSPYQDRIERISQRDNISKNLAKKIIKNQMNQKQKKFHLNKYNHIFFKNSTSISQIKIAFKNILERLNII